MTVRIGLCQIVSSPDPRTNLELVSDGVRQAAGQGAEVVLFPEATMARFGVPLAPLAEPLDGPWATAVRGIAEEHGVLVLAGMFTPAGDGRVRNTMVVTGRGVDTSYDKIHLYDAFGFQESRTVAPGDDPLLVELDGSTLGVAICYDLRFPELFRRLAADGASVILLGASWGAGPGKREQWETLVRARALDSTAWVLACGQADPATVGVATTGSTPTGIGFSTVSTPLGEIHAQLGAGTGVLVVDVDQSTVDDARKAIPVLANRRL